MPTYFPDFPALPKLPNPAAPLKNLAGAIQASKDHLSDGEQALEDLDKTRRQIGGLIRQLLRRPL